MTQIAPPIIPDVVIRFQGQAMPRILPAASDTVAIPLVHDWGPIGDDAPGSLGTDGGLQELTDYDQWVQIFGDSDTAGRTAVAGAFAGANMPGVPGAGAVVAFRMAGSSKAKATLTIQDRAATAALRLDGRYYGTRGNRISVIIDTDPANAANDRLRILLDGFVRETHSFAQTDVAGLVAAINAGSALVRATNLEAAPARLAVTAGTPLAGGNDGATLTSADHLDALDALSAKLFLFSILAPYDLTDSAIQASYLAWAQTQDLASKPTRVVLGGAAGETIATAVTRAAALNDPHLITVGIGTWHDDLVDKNLSTSQLAPRYAGILAAKGEDHSTTATKLGGIHAVGSTAPNESDAEVAVQSGVVCLVPAESPDADLKIAKGVTTWITTTESDRPKGVFGDSRLVGIMDNFVRAMRQWGNDKVIGSLPVNDDTRRDVYGEARRLEDLLLGRGLILPGDDVTIPKPWVSVENTDTDPQRNDTIPFTFGWQFARTTDGIMGQGTVL